MTRFRSNSVLPLAVLLISSLIFHSCKKSAEKPILSNAQHTAHHMHHSNSEEDIQLKADIPIYHPSEITYRNHLQFSNSENVYIRYNTAKNKKKEIIDFYTKTLPESGWEINLQKTNSERFVMHKNGHYATLRVFEMFQSDSTSTAFTINMVSPI